MQHFANAVSRSQTNRSIVQNIFKEFYSQGIFNLVLNLYVWALLLSLLLLTVDEDTSEISLSCSIENQHVSVYRWVMLLPTFTLQRGGGCNMFHLSIKAQVSVGRWAYFKYPGFLKSAIRFISSLLFFFVVVVVGFSNHIIYMIIICMEHFELIKLNSVYLYSPFSQTTNLSQSALQICTHRHPCPKTSHRIRKNSQTTLNGEKREETFRRATEEDASPGWTGAIDVMCTEWIITHKLRHSNNTINEYDRVYE